MSDGDLLPPSAPFTRVCKARASLPVGRSSCRTRDRPVGVLYLEYGKETKEVRMPTEISSLDSVWALFVTAFPFQLTTEMLQSPSMAVYIKDANRNVYYELENVRNITPYSHLKAYHKDPAHVFSRHSRLANTERRISKEELYGSPSPLHSRSLSGRSTLQSLQGSMSPPTVRSMPSSPSKTAYGVGGQRVVGPGSATVPCKHLSGAGRPTASCSSSSSAILERRDIIPDADSGSRRRTSLVLPGDVGPHYSESYFPPLQTAAPYRISSSQCSAPPILKADVTSSGVNGLPGGLQQYKASIKPLMGYRENAEQQTHSLHRVREVRTFDGQVAEGPLSPTRRALRRDSNGVALEVRNRGSSSSSSSSVFKDGPWGQPDLMSGCVHSQRMTAMEEQISSLAGLVHHALSMGSDAPRLKDGVSQGSKNELVNHQPEDSPGTQSLTPDPLERQAPPPDGGLWQGLMSAKRNICELRLQLSQLKCLQLSNLDGVRSMLRTAGQELLTLMCEKLLQSEEAACKQRAETEEDRIHYLSTEEKVLLQLSDLEDYVEHLQSSASSVGPTSLTLRDVEEGAVGLRRVEEDLAVLKGQFPVLQANMCSVLRLEVEALRFLKEEPHKMDSMLRRVRTLSETLHFLHRFLCESSPSATPAQVEPLHVLDQEHPKAPSQHSSPKPRPKYTVRAPPPIALVPLSQAEVSFGGSVQPVTHRMKGAAACVVQPCSDPHSSPLTPAERRSPSAAKAERRPQEDSSKNQNQFNTRQQTTAAAEEPPASPHTQLSQTQAEDVHCTSVDNRKQNQDQVNRSPRPSQRLHDVTSRTSEVIDGSHKDPVGAQVSTEMSDKNHLPSEFIQSAREKRRTSPSVDVTNESSDRGTCDRQSDPRRETTTGPDLKPETSGEPKDTQDEETTTGLDVEDELEEQEPSLNCAAVEKQEISPLVASPHWSESLPGASEHMNVEEVVLSSVSASTKEQVLFIDTPDQTNKENVERGPSTEEKKLLVTPQKGQSQETLTSPAAERSSVTRTLQKESTPVDLQVEPSPALQQNKSLGSNKNRGTSPISKASSGSPTSQSSRTQNQEEPVQVFTDQLYRQGGDLSSALRDNEDPSPPVPLSQDFFHRISKANIRTASKKEEPDSVCESKEPADTGHENFGFQGGDEPSDPVKGFHSELLDIESDYKRLSTIFECEEDGSLCCDGVLKQEKTKWKNEEPSADVGLGLTDVPRKNPDSPQPSASRGSDSRQQSQDQTSWFTKTGARSKFKLKLKNKLAAVSQAVQRANRIRRRSPKGGGRLHNEGKTASDCTSVTEDKNQTRESRSSEDNGQCDSSDSCYRDVDSRLSESHARVEALCQDTFRSINSLEESIKQLEISMDGIPVPPTPSQIHRPSIDAAVRPQLQDKDRHEGDRSPSKRPSTQISKGSNPPQNKRAKPQPPTSSGKTTTNKQPCHVASAH